MTKEQLRSKFPNASEDFIRLNAKDPVLWSKPRSARARQWATIGDRKLCFRSSWEIYYAKHHELLKRTGHVMEWEYEPRTFWFAGIKRGTRSYLPDFKVTFKDGRHEWHEVKGWMDKRSKTQLNRMRIYFPAEVVRVVGNDRIKHIKAVVGALAFPPVNSADALCPCK